MSREYPTGEPGPEFVRDLIQDAIDRQLPVPANIDLAQTLAECRDWHALADYLLDLEVHGPGCQTRQHPCYVCQVQARQAVGS